MAALISVCHIEHGFIIPILFLTSMIIMLRLLYQYFKSIKSERSKQLKYLGFALFGIQMTYCTFFGIDRIVWAFALDCVEGLVYVGMTISILLSAQYSVMILLLFYRLKVIFNGTVYPLNFRAIDEWIF